LGQLSLLQACSCPVWQGEAAAVGRRERTLVIPAKRSASRNPGWIPDHSPAAFQTRSWPGTRGVEERSPWAVTQLTLSPPRGVV